MGMLVLHSPSVLISSALDHIFYLQVLAKLNIHGIKWYHRIYIFFRKKPFIIITSLIINQFYYSHFVFVSFYFQRCYDFIISLHCQVSLMLSLVWQILRPSVCLSVCLSVTCLFPCLQQCIEASDLAISPLIPDVRSPHHSIHRILTLDK